MRIAFIADGRAEHAKRWIGYFGSTEDTVLLLSTYPCDPIENVTVKVLPGIFRPGNAFVKSAEPKTEDAPKKSGALGKTLVKYLSLIHI